MHDSCNVSSRAFLLALVLAIGWILPSEGIAATRRVPQDHPTIQQAIDAAQSGDTIQVAAGTYNEVLTLKSGITLEGDHRNSVVQGVSTSPVILCDNLTQPTTIRGFKITGGQYGIRVMGSVTSLTIDGNLITDNLSNQSGVGIRLESGAAATVVNNTIQASARGIEGFGNNALTIQGNTIANCRGANGGGICITGAQAPQIINNHISSCWDGAINLYQTVNAYLAQNRIVDNGAWNQSAGITISLSGNATARLYNNLVLNNTVYNAGSGAGLNASGVGSVGGTIQLYNNVFAGNNKQFSDNDPDAVGLSSLNVVAKNNIFFMNGGGNVAIRFQFMETQDFSYNDVWEPNATSPTSGVVLGPGNLQADPLFINQTDYFLASGSPCIDTGDPAPPFNDLDGTRNDMGIHGGPQGTLVDTDQDGLSDGREKLLGTNPTLPDTDGDRVLDGEEVDLYQTDPKKADTDGDGTNDGTEIEVGTNPLSAASKPTTPVFMDLPTLKQKAFDLSQATFVPQIIQPIPMLDPPVDGSPTSLGMVFEEELAITVQNLLDPQNNTFYMKATPRAALNQRKIVVYTDQDPDGFYDLRTYPDLQANYSSAIIQPPINVNLIPISGKVLSKWIVGHFQPGNGFPQFFDVGASGYVRFNGYVPQIQGASYRLASHKVFGPGEDFPVVREIYAKIVNAQVANLLVLVDSEGFTGALSMDLAPGPQSTITVDGYWYPRRNITLAQEPETGFVTYSSMFFQDERDTPTESTDEAHDTDFLVVGYDTNADGRVDKIVERQINNPSNAGEIVRTDFGASQPGAQLYWSLENRDRNPSHYSAFAGAQYHLRASYGVELLSSDVPLSVHLHEEHTEVESNDNLVINGAIREDLLKAIQLAGEVRVRYRTTAFYPDDADGDGLTDFLEGIAATDPAKADTDGDSTSDGQELRDGTDPLSAATIRLHPFNLTSSGEKSSSAGFRLQSAVGLAVVGRMGGVQRELRLGWLEQTN